MPVKSPSKPVTDSVPKVNDEIAVGSDLQFQRRWWKFERGAWIFFSIIIVLALLGCFGRGPVANAQARASDGSLEVRYERIERFSTPSTLTVSFRPDVAHDGHVSLWVSDDLVKRLGNQRVIPEPTASVLKSGGIQYTFSANAPAYDAAFSLRPEMPGLHHLTLQAEGRVPVHLSIFVMP